MVLFHETRPQRGSTSDNAAPAATNKELDVEAMITEIIMEKVLKDPESPDKGHMPSSSAAAPNPGVGKRPWNWVDPVTRKEYSGTRTSLVSHSAILEHRKKLPIYDFRRQFIHAVESNQVVVVVGETGSGKSTQMPQYLLESGLIGENRKIAITQPRRVAAVSVAQRVSDEMDCRLGELVGYSIRFEDMTSAATVIKYMTDGLLLMECLKDPLFVQYGCVILDEAHERTLHTDVLLGLLKKAIRIRPELKVIITSATLDIKKFADYFEAPMVRIPGKMFPVAVEYAPVDDSSMARRANKTDSYLSSAIKRVMQIHESADSFGDILLFLPGKDEVDQACGELTKRISERAAGPSFVVLPVYAAMPFETQCKIFEEAPKGKRKVIVATNIAETSLTIDGILYVVDTGFFKESIFEHGMETLRVTVISKAQAEQRAGRAGRTAPGQCFRLYSAGDYKKMALVPSPAIHRNDLTSTVLQLKVLGIGDICGFGFMDPPMPLKVDHALGCLRELGALERDMAVTDLGFKMAEFPLSPNLAKVLLVAAGMDCSDEVLTIVSMLSGNHNIFIRPKTRRQEADDRKRAFNDYKGDHLTLLNVFEEWKRNEMSVEWSQQNFVQQKQLERALDIRNQLLNIMNSHAVPVISCWGRKLANIRRALASGLPNQVAYRDQRVGPDAYRTLSLGYTVYIHPSSALYEELPDLVTYHETVKTSRMFIRTVSICEPGWLPPNMKKMLPPWMRKFHPYQAYF